MKKIISLLLCLCLLAGLIPASFAAESADYLALGDSITAGKSLNEGEPAFPQILAEDNHWSLTNLGANGQSAEGLAEELSDGSLDDAIAGAKTITITAGINDIMDVVYQLVAQKYNAAHDPDITPDEVLGILADSDDSRWADLLVCCVQVMEGDAEAGIPPFAEREEFLTQIEEFIADLEEVIAHIRELNTEATVIVPTQYNPYKDFSGAYEILADNVDEGVRKLNKAITDAAEESGYLVADVFTAFQNSSETLCIATASPLELDFHPNARGHEVIAQVMQEVIDQLSEEPEPTDPEPTDPEPTDPEPTEPEPIENPFTDVKSTDYFYEPVLWAVEKGVTTGISATIFGPNNTCTRAQVVTFLWRAAGEPAPTSTKNPFTDVKSSAYYYDAVLWAVEKGITTGMSATSFDPNRSCTRGHVVTFLHRAAGTPEPESAKNPFTDVKSSGYYYDAVLWAVENGITTGMSATSFDPNRPCTRGQVVTFLYRAD